VTIYRPHELSAISSQTRPSAVVTVGGRTGRRHIDEWNDALRTAKMSGIAHFGVGVEATDTDWSELPSRRDDATPHVPTEDSQPGECALILFTSGTTADPKGVRHDSRSLAAEVASYRDGAHLGAEDVVFIPAPMAHVGALVASTLLPCFTGAKAVVMPAWDPALAVKVVAAERATFAIGAPVFLSGLLDSYETDASSAHRITKFHTGAAPAAAEVIVRAETLGVLAWRAWGMTEAPTITYGGPDAPLARRAGFDGRIEPGSEVQAVAEDRRPLRVGEIGELRLRSPKQMMGYVSAEQTSAQVDDDGWIYSGDLGWVTEDGWVTITGRVKDIINRGGEKFSALEIEQAISTHPTVSAAAVVGVPDPRLGESVAAFVTLNEGSTYPGDAAMSSHLDAIGLARQKTPIYWTVLRDLPLTATGKIQKRELIRSLVLQENLIIPR
jgi:acyl-CoA synthetase (AMP-forming)/AMP-acid ligase II